MPRKRGRGVQRDERTFTPAERSARDGRAVELVAQGVDCLRQSRVAAAQRKFRQALSICNRLLDARSLLALTYVLQRNWEQGATEATAVLLDEPDHLIALTVLARAQAGAGQPVEANNYSAKALRQFYGRDRGQARSVDELGHVIHMLVDLGNHRRLHQLYQRCLRGHPLMLDETWLAYLGIAAFNSGHHRDARWIWRWAEMHSEERSELFASYLFANDLVEQGRIPHFLLDYALGAEAEPSYPAEPQGFLKVFALRTLWFSEDGQARRAALELLSYGDEEWEASFLTSLLQDPELADEVKMHAGTLLIERGFVPEDDPLEMYIEGELRPVVIRTERTEIDLDEEAAAFFSEALEADAQGLGETAEAGYRAVLELVPTFVPALIGLATICRYSGRLDEAEKLLLDALQVEPVDPLVLFNLATLRLQQEQYRDAWTMLRGINVGELPPDLRPLYYWTVGRLALQFDMPDAAEKAFRQGLRLDPASEELVAGLAAATKSVGEARRRVTSSSSGRRQRHENQPIDGNISWTEALRRLTLPCLRAIGRHVGLRGATKLRKSELVEAVVASLREQLKALWHSLSPQEQAAVRWIDGQGGVVPYEQLRRRYGSDVDDSIDWLKKEPETVPMRLRYSGLLFVGRLRGRSEPVVVLPREVRHALRFAWQDD